MMRHRPHICMLLDHAFPPDLRVENEARTLSSAGYDVTVLAIDPDSRPSSDLAPHIHVRRVRVPRQIRNKARGLAATVPLMDLIVGRAVRKLHNQRPIAALHAENARARAQMRVKLHF